MPATTNWAIGAGFAIVAVAIGGGAAWQRQHPNRALIADLASVLPAIPRLDPKPNATVPSAKDGKAADAKAVPHADTPHFDVARVEPAGGTVVAGSGVPNTKVALMEGAEVLAETQSDANGQFVLLPPPLASGNVSLTLRQSPDGKPAVESSQKLVLSVPSGGKGQVAIALAEPGKPTRILSAPPVASALSAPSTPAPVSAKATSAAPPKSMSSTAAPTRLAIQSSTVGNGNGFDASGIAPPGTKVHLYLNESHLADVVTGRDGQWQVVIRRDLAGGHYTLRADAISGDQVADQVEVPFDVPVAMAAATSVSPADSRPIPFHGADGAVVDAAPPRGPSAPAGQVAEGNDGSKITGPGAARTSTPAGTSLAAETSTSALSVSPDPAHAVIDVIETRKVFGGDNLWRISRASLGRGTRFSQIFAANANQIRDPNLIYPGQIFVLPHR